MHDYTDRARFRNHTSILGNAFQGLAVGYIQTSLAHFTIEQIAINFIAAQVEQGLQDAQQRQISYLFTDTREGPVRIDIAAVPGAPQDLMTRANVMFALNRLPIALMNENWLEGGAFWEHYHGEPLFAGIFDNQNGNTLDHQSPDLNTNVIAVEKKRSSNDQQSTVQQINATSAVLSVSDNAIPHMELNFYHVGAGIPKIEFFATILNCVFDLGLANASDGLEEEDYSDLDSPVWIFAREVPGISVAFQIYHLAAILEAVARWTVQQGIYDEVVFDFFIDQEFVSTGCVMRRRRGMQWCRGLRGDSGLWGDLEPFNELHINQA